MFTFEPGPLPALPHTPATPVTLPKPLKIGILNDLSPLQEDVPGVVC